MNRDAFVCLVLYELVIILTVLLISVNLQFCLKLSVNFVDLSFLSRISFFFFTLFLKCNLCFSIILCYFTIKVCNTSFYFITMIYRSTDKYSFYFILFLLSGYILPMSEMIWLLHKVIPECSCFYCIYLSKLFQQTKRLFLNFF